MDPKQERRRKAGNVTEFRSICELAGENYRTVGLHLEFNYECCGKRNMAKKAGCRTIHREVANHNRSHQILPDEITLRDEILELKRQVMALKRTNEQYLVKLRKYEDETKRKDKQLEQLLDPRKNADITKVLSTKGAAILMNLKDQNNTLVQMMLNKDLHIRRLAAELKMSKLYASTRKNESYRAEITRLRNLLIKSQETLKENVDVQQRTRSICVSGNSLLEFSSSSDQSTPRDLDELRMTILSLESHIQHSNDLIVKKNQEISHLTDELNILRKFFRYKTYKNKSFDCKPTVSKNLNISTPDFTCQWSEPSQHVLEALEKNQENEENLPRSAPAASLKLYSPVDSTPKLTSQSNEVGQENQAGAVIILKDKENFESLNKTVPSLGKSLFHNIATNEVLKEKILSNSNKIIYTKEIWKRALNRFRELKKLNPELFNECDQNQEGQNKITTKILRVETTKSITESQENFIQEFDGSEIFEKTEDGRSTPSNTCGNINESTPEMCQNSKKNFNKRESSEMEKSISEEKREHIQTEPQEFFRSFQNVWNKEETESKPARSLREIYRQSLDSSFDSESSSPMKQEIRQVQVEVQINSFPSQTDSDQSESITSEDQKFESGRTGKNCLTDFDFNDDDDVIVREK